MRHPLTLLLCLICATAHATPPRSIIIEDRLFGRTADNVMILREARDNHGYYTTTQTDTFLIVHHYADGREEVLPVDSIYDGGPDMPSGRVRIMPIENRMDIYALRRNRAAWRPFTFAPHSQTITLDDAGLSITHENGSRYAMPLGALQQQVDSTLTRTRAAMQHTETDVLETYFPGSQIDLIRECTVERLSYEYEGLETHMLLLLWCMDEDWAQMMTLWVAVPKV